MVVLGFPSPSLTISWLRAVLDPLGGHTVTSGKAREEIGWVLVVVDIGESDQFLKELLIRKPAVVNPVAIVKAQRLLAKRDFELEIWEKP